WASAWAAGSARGSVGASTRWWTRPRSIERCRRRWPRRSPKSTGQCRRRCATSALRSNACSTTRLRSSTRSWSRTSTSCRRRTRARIRSRSRGSSDVAAGSRACQGGGGEARLKRPQPTDELQIDQQLDDRLARDGIDEPGRNLGERLEDEPPLAKARMRDNETGLVQDVVAVQNQIEVERARRIR